LAWVVLHAEITGITEAKSADNKTDFLKIDHPYKDIPSTTDDAKGWLDSVVTDAGAER
jgi:hypothetical protein